MTPKEIIDGLKKELAETKVVLQDLVDLQNGPPLLQHTQEWELTMKIANEILKPVEEKNKFESCRGKCINTGECTDDCQNWPVEDKK